MGVAAQSVRTTDFGGIVSSEAAVSLGGSWGITMEEELRFQNDFAHFDRWLNSLGVDYLCLHNRMNVGLSADYIRRNNKNRYYENRTRLGMQVTYTETYRHLRFAFRSKALATFYDGQTAVHRINPRIYWRNRMKVVWQPMNSRWKYALSMEVFWHVNNPQGSCVDNLRTVVSVDYRLARRYSLSAFARMDNEIQVKEPVDRLYLGLTFKAKY